MRGVERKIKASKDFTLKTYYEVHTLVKDEVKVIRFKDDPTFKSLLKFKHFVVAKPNEKEVRNIPVLLPEVVISDLVEQKDIKEEVVEEELPPMELVIEEQM